MAERRKSSILVNRKLSTDFHRKLSAISVASDVSFISERFGMEQGELKNIVADILEMNINDDFDVSEYFHVFFYKIKSIRLGVRTGCPSMATRTVTGSPCGRSSGTRRSDWTQGSHPAALR